MRALYLLLLAILLFCPIIYSSALWSYVSFNEFQGKPIIISDKAIFSTQGKIVALSATTGLPLWSYEIKGKLAVPAVQVSQNTIAFASKDAKIYLLSTEGKEISVLNVSSAPLYLSGSQGVLVASFSLGAQAYSEKGELLWNFILTSPAGPVGIESNRVYFTSGRKLYALSLKNGARIFEVPAENSFMSVPREYKGNLYFGATDGRLYSFDAVSGKQRWFFQTNGWVQSTPAFHENSIFFGSNDGFFYSLSESGNLRFKFKAEEGIWHEPVFFEGKNGSWHAVFASNDGYLYGIDADDGTLYWSYSFEGMPSGIALSKGRVFFGSTSGKAYAFSPSSVCGFLRPKNGQSVGGWIVDVYGISYSDEEDDWVEVRLEGQEWKRAEGDRLWQASFDFTNLSYGAFKIECRLRSDADADRKNYASLTVIKNQNTPLQKMFVSAPMQAQVGEEISIAVKDEYGNELSGLSLLVDGEKKEGKSPFTLQLKRAGAASIEISKSGFEPVRFNILAEDKNALPWPLFAFAALLFAAAIAAYKLLLKK